MATVEATFELRTFGMGESKCAEESVNYDGGRGENVSGYSSGSCCSKSPLGSSSYSGSDGEVAQIYSGFKYTFSALTRLSGGDSDAASPPTSLKPLCSPDGAPTARCGAERQPWNLQQLVDTLRAQRGSEYLQRVRVGFLQKLADALGDAVQKLVAAAQALFGRCHLQSLRAAADWLLVSPAADVRRRFRKFIDVRLQQTRTFGRNWKCKGAWQCASLHLPMNAYFGTVFHPGRMLRLLQQLCKHEDTTSLDCAAFVCNYCEFLIVELTDRVLEFHSNVVAAEDLDSFLAESKDAPLLWKYLLDPNHQLDWSALSASPNADEEFSVFVATPLGKAFVNQKSVVVAQYFNRVVSEGDFAKICSLLDGRRCYPTEPTSLTDMASQFLSDDDPVKLMALLKRFPLDKCWHFDCALGQPYAHEQAPTDQRCLELASICAAQVLYRTAQRSNMVHMQALIKLVPFPAHVVKAALLLAVAQDNLPMVKLMLSLTGSHLDNDYELLVTAALYNAQKCFVHILRVAIANAQATQQASEHIYCSIDNPVTTADADGANCPALSPAYRQLLQNCLYVSAECGDVQQCLALHDAGVAWSIHSWCTTVLHSPRPLLGTLLQQACDCRLFDDYATSSSFDTCRSAVSTVVPLLWRLVFDKANAALASLAAELLAHMAGSAPIPPVRPLVYEPAADDGSLIRVLCKVGHGASGRVLSELLPRQRLRPLLAAQQAASGEPAAELRLSLGNVSVETALVLLLHLKGADEAMEHELEAMLRRRAGQSALEEVLCCAAHRVGSATWLRELERFCSRRLTVDNCAHVFRLCRKFGLPELATYCGRFLLKQLPLFVAQPRRCGLLLDVVGKKTSLVRKLQQILVGQPVAKTNPSAADHRWMDQLQSQLAPSFPLPTCRFAEPLQTSDPLA